MKQLHISLMILVGLTAVGALSLMAVGDRGLLESVYMTVVVLTTVGMEGPVSDAERWWALVLMIGGIGALLYATGQLVSFVVEGQFRQMIGRHKMIEQIQKLKSHFIVIGFGRMGESLCSTLKYRDRPFVLIECDPVRFKVAEELGYLCIEGDADQDQTLQRAGIDRASGLVTCLPRDADNVLIALTARGMNPDMMITARSENTQAQSKMHRAGADHVICPAVIGAARASDQLMYPQIDDMLELDGHWPDLELSRVSLSRFPGLTAKKLADLYSLVGERTLVVALIRSDGTRLLHPKPSTPLNKDDQVVFIGDAGCVDHLVTIFNGARAA